MFKSLMETSHYGTYKAALHALFQQLTDDIGTNVPTTYNTALDIVESLYGCLKDSSSQ